MKTLNIIQRLSMIGKILSKIMFIFCIIGFCGCIVGILSMSLGAPTLKIGGVTLESILNYRLLWLYRWDSQYGARCTDIENRRRNVEKHT